MTECKPIFLDKNQEVILKNKRPHVIEIDAFSRQIRELFFIENHKYIGLDKEKAYKTKDFKNYANKKKNDFVYVFYPWNSHLVKTVEADDYFKLKTNRNQDLITEEEQKKLYKYKVAVLGMSVGSNIASILTQAGISRDIVLADFDEIDTTNLNRIQTGIHEVGLNKAVVASRRIYEGNPFANVTIFQRATPKNLGPLLKAKKINCIVEEVDDIVFKIEARMLAIKYKVPVVMITDNGDGVVLHVERYDLGHDKIFGKDLAYWKEKIKKGITSKEDAAQIIIGDIVGSIEKVDPRMIASVKKVLGKELISWPQLGSAALLGGVMSTYIIKQIVLGAAKQPDIRAYIHPNQINFQTHLL
jgi:molybdopterin/thiamine biosynthesis adenylyltransferase